MKNLFRKHNRGEKGFTLIELLIVIAVLGILAAVVIPNVKGFMISGRIAAGNAEAGSINTAVSAYCAENSIADSSGLNWTTAELATNLTPYLSASPKYTYTLTAGVLAGIDGTGTQADTDGLKWNPVTKQWARE